MSIDYSAARLILAPMVRVGSLPMRLLALDYGADLVYAEEIIDHKMLKCKRIVNYVLGTIDFVDPGSNEVVFRTCDREKGKLIFQIGTADPDRAAKVAKIVEQDVSGIDINMGCPKEFSLKGGMGAALLSQPETIRDILTSVKKSVSISVSCKIRILEKIEDTLALCKLIESCRVSALGVHGRMIHERPRHDNRDDVIRTIKHSLSIPVIANGGSGTIKCHEDIDRFLERTGCNCVMLARAVQSNVSILSSDGLRPINDIILQYLKYAVDYDNHALNAKYCIQQMLGDLQETSEGRRLLCSKNLRDICEIWSMEAYYDEKQAEFASTRKELLARKQDGVTECNKRLKGDDDVIVSDVMFERNKYSHNELPKNILYYWAIRKGLQPPTYKTVQDEKLFRSVVSFENCQYTTTIWEKNKKSAEQSAALACCTVLKLINKNA